MLEQSQLNSVGASLKAPALPKRIRKDALEARYKLFVSCIKLSKFSKQLGIFTGSPRTLGSCF